MDVTKYIPESKLITLPDEETVQIYKSLGLHLYSFRSVSSCIQNAFLLVQLPPSLLYTTSPQRTCGGDPVTLHACQVHTNPEQNNCSCKLPLPFLPSGSSFGLMLLSEPGLRLAAPLAAQAQPQKRLLYTTQFLCSFLKDASCHAVVFCWYLSNTFDLLKCIWKR